jgi:DNA-binding SARP family transcriptional activator
VGRGGSRLIVRDGDTYRLDLPPDAVVDVAAFEDDVNRAIRARNAGDSPAAAACFLRALDLYAGDLLPGDGPAEWVVDRREQLRRLAVVAAESLAELAIAAGDGAAAAWACTSGLRIDRYHDPLWRNLIAARELAGDPGAAGRARREYETVLAGLGVGPSPS